MFNLFKCSKNNPDKMLLEMEDLRNIIHANQIRFVSIEKHDATISRLRNDINRLETKVCMLETLFDKISKYR